MRTTPVDPLMCRTMREALRATAAELLGPGESFEVHLATQADGRPYVGRSGIVKTPELLEQWGDFLDERGTGDNPDTVRFCCGRTVVILHERGGELIAMD